ncbi:MAG: hypothetical protein RDV41_12300 [Planctomycetota bacterium]|nr:hypothetical protein [Planctomycetota bacterium]
MLAWYSGNCDAAREAKGDIAGAIADYEKALEPAPSSWRHRKTLEQAPEGK